MTEHGTAHIIVTDEALLSRRRALDPGRGENALEGEPVTTASGVYGRVVCGVDHSEAGIAAARAAGRVAEQDGTLTIVAVDDTSIAVHAGWAMPPSLSELGAARRAGAGRGARGGRAAARG